MPDIVADRFLATAISWTDLATGAPVRLRVCAAGTADEQLAWSARCAALANLRHPLINPLLDFGALGTDRLFEAYAAGHPVPASGAAAERLKSHANRFLEHHDIILPASVARFVMRPLVSGKTALRRPVGVVLQPRAAFDAISDALDTASPAGVCTVRVAGAPNCGLRTLRLLLARTARLQGYVPVRSRAIEPHRSVIGHLAGRHVCVLHGEGEETPASVADFVARLDAEGARRHVMFTFARSTGSTPARAVRVEPMGVTAMTGMVFVDFDHALSPGDVLDAARQSEGRPGLFLAKIGASGFEPHQSRAILVHETAPAYVVAGESASRPAPRHARRTTAVALRAATRGEALARAGRHSSAMRILARATRVLSARGEPQAAADCALLQGWHAVDRARVAAAVRAFESARDLCRDAQASIASATGIGAAWTDDGRLLEAEAILRGAVVAAEALGDPALWTLATAGLGRCLYWQGRYDEAGLVAESAERGVAAPAAARARLAVVVARVHLAQGVVPAAMRAARQAVDLASAAADPRTLTSAYRVLAAATLAAGDPDAARHHVREGLRTAKEAHLPLAAVRLRIIWLEILAAADQHGDARRLAVHLHGASGRLPKLLRFAVSGVCARCTGTQADQAVRDFVRTSGAVALDVAVARPANAVADLEALLEIGHRAEDDRRALDGICEALQQKLRSATVLVAVPTPEPRILAVAGRPWHGDPQIAWRALAAGQAVAPDCQVEPCQAAETLRYSGEVIAAVACRWVAGATFDVRRSQALLRVGALALAPHVRALLDRAVPASTGVGWKDLLGDSPPVVALREAISRAARAPFPILVEGESGSGKELVARAIHRLSTRRDRRFCALNCAALSDDLLEAELFGHARGAFTGAVGERPGLFEDADGGTLFLDEIGELSPRAQAKLLRVLQDGEVRRVGENMSRRVDVRIVAATNRRLQQESVAGRFRADLRFRLDVVRIEVPPLRDRSSDVPMLAVHFWADAVSRVGSRATLAPDTLAALARYDWPGNVRELQNVIAWMAVHSPHRGRVAAGALPAHLAQSAGVAASTFEAARAEFERRFVRAALATASGQRVRAAEAMGVTRQGLAKMLRRLGIEDTCR